MERNSSQLRVLVEAVIGNLDWRRQASIASCVVRGQAQSRLKILQLQQILNAYVYYLPILKTKTGVIDLA
jgi:hypothetical protein